MKFNDIQRFLHHHNGHNHVIFSVFNQVCCEKPSYFKHFLRFLKRIFRKMVKILRAKTWHNGSEKVALFFFSQNTEALAKTTQRWPPISTKFQPYLKDTRRYFLRFWYAVLKGKVDVFAWGNRRNFGMHSIPTVYNTFFVVCSEDSSRIGPLGLLSRVHVFNAFFCRSRRQKWSRFSFQTTPPCLFVLSYGKACMQNLPVFHENIKFWKCFFCVVSGRSCDLMRFSAFKNDDF